MQSKKGGLAMRLSDVSWSLGMSGKLEDFTGELGRTVLKYRVADTVFCERSSELWHEPEISGELFDIGKPASPHFIGRVVNMWEGSGRARNIRRILAKIVDDPHRLDRIACLGNGVVDGNMRFVGF